MDLNRLKTFYYVALEGSYQKASTHLGIKSSYISKHITSLEDLLKIKLFKRSHRSLILSEQGEEFFKSVQIVMQQIEKIEAISKIGTEEEDDTIRIVTTTGVTNLVVIRRLNEFMMQYPKYKIRVLAVEEKIDFSTHFADVAILPKINPNPNIMQKKLYTLHSRLFASTKYLVKFGVPQNVEDLDNHRLISFYHNEAGYRGDVDWHLKIGAKLGVPREPYLVINSAIGQFEALRKGVGILAIPEEFPYLNEPHIVKVLPDEGVDIPIYFATHTNKMHFAKIAALDNFFTQLAKKTNFLTQNSLSEID